MQQLKICPSCDLCGEATKENAPLEQGRKAEEEATGLRQQGIYHRTDGSLDPQSETDSSQGMAPQEPLAATCPDGSRRRESASEGISRGIKHRMYLPVGQVFPGSGDKFDNKE